MNSVPFVGLENHDVDDLDNFPRLNSKMDNQEQLNQQQNQNQNTFETKTKNSKNNNNSSNINSPSKIWNQEKKEKSYQQQEFSYGDNINNDRIQPWYWNRYVAGMKERQQHQKNTSSQNSSTEETNDTSLLFSQISHDLWNVDNLEQPVTFSTPSGLWLIQHGGFRSPTSGYSSTTPVTVENNVRILSCIDNHNNNSSQQQQQQQQAKNKNQNQNFVNKTQWKDYPTQTPSNLRPNRAAHAGIVFRNFPPDAAQNKQSLLLDQLLDNPLQDPIQDLRCCSLLIHGGKNDIGKYCSDLLQFDFFLGKWKKLEADSGCEAPRMIGHAMHFVCSDPSGQQEQYQDRYRSYFEKQQQNANNDNEGNLFGVGEEEEDEFVNNNNNNKNKLDENEVLPPPPFSFLDDAILVFGCEVKSENVFYLQDKRDHAFPQAHSCKKDLDYDLKLGRMKHKNNARRRHRNENDDDDDEDEQTLFGNFDNNDDLENFAVDAGTHDDNNNINQQKTFNSVPTSFNRQHQFSDLYTFSCYLFIFSDHFWQKIDIINPPSSSRTNFSAQQVSEKSCQNSETFFIVGGTEVVEGNPFPGIASRASNYVTNRKSYRELPILELTWYRYGNIEFSNKQHQQFANQNNNNVEGKGIMLCREILWGSSSFVHRSLSSSSSSSSLSKKNEKKKKHSSKKEQDEDQEEEEEDILLFPTSKHKVISDNISSTHNDTSDNSSSSSIELSKKLLNSKFGFENVSIHQPQLQQRLQHWTGNFNRAPTSILGSCEGSSIFLPLFVSVDGSYSKFSEKLGEWLQFESEGGAGDENIQQHKNDDDESDSDDDDDDEKQQQDEIDNNNNKKASSSSTTAKVKFNIFETLSSVSVSGSGVKSEPSLLSDRGCGDFFMKDTQKICGMKVSDWKKATVLFLATSVSLEVVAVMDDSRAISRHHQNDHHHHHHHNQNQNQNQNKNNYSDDIHAPPTFLFPIISLPLFHHHPTIPSTNFNCKRGDTHSYSKHHPLLEFVNGPLVASDLSLRSCLTTTTNTATTSTDDGMMKEEEFLVTLTSLKEELVEQQEQEQVKDEEKELDEDKTFGEWYKETVRSENQKSQQQQQKHFGWCKNKTNSRPIFGLHSDGSLEMQLLPSDLLQLLISMAEEKES